MVFLRNAWYVAGWSEEVGEQPIARTILSEPIVLFRTSDGAISAFVDACPHRFAPLSLGKVQDDTIRCPYHGLVFDKVGTCVRNPHGKGARPASLALTAFPITEADGLVWIWMGKPELATTQPPAYPFLKNASMKTLSGYLHVKANYELVTDNLMDLSHVEFLHPFIGSEGMAEAIQFRAEPDGDKVAALHSMPEQPNTEMFKLVLGEDVSWIDGYANSYWEAPANLYLRTGATSCDVDAGRHALLEQAHLLTPETETSTHYFWGVSRDRAVDDERLDQILLAGLAHAFAYEDEPMIQVVQQRMRGRPLFDLGPALLSMDEAAVRARRVLARLISAEQSASRP